MPLITLSTAEKQAAAGALILLLLQAAATWHGALEYRQALIEAEPWRLLTGHVVHINWSHALINAAAWVIVARLFAPELAGWRQAGALLASALVIAVTLAVIHPSIEWYRGFSGVLHGVFFAGATCWLLTTLRGGELGFARLWLPVLLFVGGWIKVVAEQPSGSATPYAEWLGAGTVPQAHLAGAFAGALLGALFARRAQAAPAPSGPA